MLGFRRCVEFAPPLGRALARSALVGALSVGAVFVARPAVAAQTIDESFRAGRYDLAFEALDEIEDPSLQDEWRFQILYASGDLTGALAAVIDGLERAPHHLGLLQNGTNCALSLGLAQIAARWCAEWRIAIDASQLAPDAREAQLASVARHEQFVEPMLEGESALDSARRRGLIVTLTLLAGATVALVWLARAK